ncbi:tripartite tricarboxylate transporter TctB family protein [Sedimentitalea todarodis]|uniref:Tripartite tricarboxylate transporter TctB family protein n=1 Tax=Sedimentitalea todarodis TaxID=1631240 RepID=A0ABU3VDW0_9RHOB|nr:tripartite tricarboxylate transporter TctB family protein [Sedimentitalea todarodis]MDU9004357.1 tripartite tricarboxylate transporter TctB family protein [Sedimentitalea todarodis]
MINLTDRFCGLFFTLFGPMLFFFLIPTQVETVDFGAIRPKTMPQILSVIISVFGVVLMLKPADGTELRQQPWVKACLIIAILVTGLWSIAQIGFVFVAPPLALVLMLVMGERRPLWIGLGAVGMPALIGFAVTVLLERPLP